MSRFEVAAARRKLVDALVDNEQKLDVARCSGCCDAMASLLHGLVCAHSVIEEDEPLRAPPNAQRTRACCRRFERAPSGRTPFELEDLSLTVEALKRCSSLRDRILVSGVATDEVGEFQIDRPDHLCRRMAFDGGKEPAIIAHLREGL